MIKAQQAYGGLDKKFKAIKDIQPFVRSMRDNGFIENPEKYELAVRAVNGDVDAIQQLLKDNKVDPMDLDLDEVKYSAKNTEVDNELKIVYNDVLDDANDLGVGDKFNDVLFKEFDEASRAELFKDEATTKAMGAELATQLSNGLYDKVTDKMEVLALRDKSFSSKRFLDRYNEAAMLVNEELAKEAKATQKTSKAKSGKTEATKVAKEKAKIEAERKKKEYEAKAKEQEKKVRAARSKAAKSSKPKKSTPTEKSSPLDLPKEEFATFWDDLLALNGN